MAHQENHHDSREGLLKLGSSYPLRPSLEEAYRYSSDSNDRLDSLDLETEDRIRQSKRASRHPSRSWIPKQPPWSTGYTFQDKQIQAQKHPARKKTLWEWLVPRKTCLLIALILALGLMTVIGSGALWVYKTAPPDGVSHFGMRNYAEADHLIYSNRPLGIRHQKEDL